MKKLLFVALLLVVVGIGCLHFFTPGHHVLYHDTYRRLSYFPIVLGGLFFGLRGGLAMGVLSSLAFIPHLLLYFGERPESYLGELFEIVLYLAAGTVTGFIAGREARLRDQYKALSEKLDRSYNRLHEQTELLLEVEEQLGASQKFSALGKLSASLAHEIKNPLGAIRGTGEILRDEFPVGHPKREFVEILLKEVERLNRSVEEVLGYARPKRRAGEQPRASLEREIEQVARLLEVHLRKKSVSFEMRGLGAGRDYPVDRGKLSQVFLNLVLNGIEAVSSGGRIVLDVRPEENGGLRATVCDNGPGVAAAEREKIFEPFYSGKEEGTGLGLSISRKIVESHGGTLTVGDSPLGGCCFTVHLPPLPVANGFTSPGAAPAFGEDHDHDRHYSADRR